jgi:AcrR family transcriptional regulator
LAEGTLFTYFPTKNDLLNQLYLELSRDLVNTLSAEYPSSGSAQDRITHLMERLINWGVENRLQHKAKYQLRGSDRISAKTHRRSEALFQQLGKMVEASLKGRFNPELASFYIDLLFAQSAEITVRRFSPTLRTASD